MNLIKKNNKNEVDQVQTIIQLNDDGTFSPISQINENAKNICHSGLFFT